MTTLVPPTQPILEDRRPSVGRRLGFVLLLAGVALGLATFSAFPWAATLPGAAVLKVAFKHVAAFEEERDGPSPAAIEKLPRHMRPQSAERARTGRRRDTLLVLTVDGRSVLRKTYRPGGLRHDGPTFAYEELAVPLGRHRLEVVLADPGDGGRGSEARQWQLDRDVDIQPGHVLLVELDEEGRLTVRSPL